MLDPDLRHGGRTGMTGYAVVPKLETVRDGRRRTTHLGIAQPGGKHGQPVVRCKRFVGHFGDVALITEFFFRMRRDRCIGLLFNIIATSFMAGEAVFRPA